MRFFRASQKSRSLPVHHIDMITESVNSPQQNLESKRYFYLDLLRIIATFGVIFIHLSMDTNYWYVALVYDGMVRWSVPVFVMISGALFLNPRKELSISTVLNKYIKRLLLSYIFWYLFYCLFRFTRDCIASNSFEITYLSFTPHFHLWFLPMLMCVYLLIPILRKIACENDLLRYALLLWVVCLTFNFIMIRTVPQISGLFQMNQVIGYAGYFLLGYYLAYKSWTKRQQFIIYLSGILGVLIIVFGSVFLYYYKGVIPTRFLYNVTLHVAVMASALFLFIKQIAPRIEKQLAGFVRYVRKSLFGIYLVHLIWIMLLERPNIWNLCNHALLIPLLAIVVFILSLYTTKLLSCIPFLKRFVE